MGVAGLPETEIDVPGLTGVGNAVAGVAARMTGTARDIEGWAYQGRHAFEGSVVCSSGMSSAASTWAREIQEMAGEVRRFGEDLKRTAADYQAYDDLTAQQVRQIY
jgi:hypothetical protein